MGQIKCNVEGCGRVSLNFHAASVHARTHISNRKGPATKRISKKKKPLIGATREEGRHLFQHMGKA